MTVLSSAFLGSRAVAQPQRRASPARPSAHSSSLCDAATCRAALGLDPARPVVLVMGGSQGASGINELVCRRCRSCAERSRRNAMAPPGRTAMTREIVDAGLRRLNLKAVVHPFLAEMELALGAATVAISRAGASSLAELAAMRVPAVLVPYPAATDNHQFHNARALKRDRRRPLAGTGGATAGNAGPAALGIARGTLPSRERMRHALAQWHAPEAAGADCRRHSRKHAACRPGIRAARGCRLSWTRISGTTADRR